MRIIEPYAEVQTFDGVRMMKNIERAARTCYKSEGAITEDSYKGFIRKIIQSGHESVLEHEKITCRIICDRGVSHELVRHRLASYSQESTRYCNYSSEGFGGEITVIRPLYFNSKTIDYWRNACQIAEDYYFGILSNGESPQGARSVLPNSLKTEIVMTANLREWRHFFRLRADKAAHPQMQQIAIPLLLFLQEQMPGMFDNISFNRDFLRTDYAEVRWEE